MVWHSKSRQHILTAVKSLHYNKLIKKFSSIYQLFYFNYIKSNMPARQKVTYSNTAGLRDSNDAEYF